MKRIAILLILFTLTLQLAVTQKIKLNYKITTSDSTFHQLRNAYSSNNIQKNAETLFKENNIISISDDVNRRFEKISLDNETYLFKILNKGHLNFFQIKNHKKKQSYYIISDGNSSSFTLKDSISNNKKNAKNLRILLYLDKNNPDFLEITKKIPYSEGNIQDYISHLNQKYPEKNEIFKTQNKFKYLNFVLKGFALGKNKDFSMDILMTHYFVDLSSNISLRYGVKTNYYEKTEFYPKLWSGLFTGTPPNTDSVFVHFDHYEKTSASVFEIPFAVNYELTNSSFTPFLCGGFSPSLALHLVDRTDSEIINKDIRFSVNLFAAAGLKYKITNNLNILSEYRFDTTKGLNFLFGIEYYRKL